MEFTDEHRTALIVASGPSAGLANLDATRGCAPAIAVSDGWTLIPWAESVYCGDAKWWDYHAARVAAEFAGERWTCEPNAARRHGLRAIRCHRTGGLSKTPGTIAQGGSIGFSGAQAINLAYQWGARRLLLVGFDMGSQAHFFGDHPPAIKTTSPWSAMILGLADLARDLVREHVPVINCSPGSAIKFWPVMTLEAGLAAFNLARGAKLV